MTGGGTTSFCVANTTAEQHINMSTKMTAVRRYPIAASPLPKAETMGITMIPIPAIEILARVIRIVDSFARSSVF